MTTSPATSRLGRHEFLVRRLHSLTGLIPVGAYMVVHLLVNSSLLTGPSTFQKNVYQIHGLEDALLFVEWAFIFLPILFHGLIGLLIFGSGQSNVGTYPLRRQLPLHAAAGHGPDRLGVHPLARVPPARLVPCRAGGWRTSAEPLGGAQFPALQRGLDAGRRRV